MRKKLRISIYFALTLIYVEITIRLNTNTLMVINSIKRSKTTKKFAMLVLLTIRTWLFTWRDLMALLTVLLDKSMYVEDASNYAVLVAMVITEIRLPGAA